MSSLKLANSLEEKSEELKRNSNGSSAGAEALEACSGCCIKACASKGTSSENALLKYVTKSLLNLLMIGSRSWVMMTAETLYVPRSHGI